LSASWLFTSYQWRKPRENLIIVLVRERDRVDDTNLLRVAMHELSEGGWEVLWRMLCGAVFTAGRIDEVEIMFCHCRLIQFYLRSDYCL
jgi:hypothetical protein